MVGKLMIISEVHIVSTCAAEVTRQGSRLGAGTGEECQRLSMSDSLQGPMPRVEVGFRSYP